MHESNNSHGAVQILTYGVLRQQAYQKENECSARKYDVTIS